MLFHQVGESKEKSAAIPGVHFPPFGAGGKGRFCGGDGHIDVFAAAESNFANLRFVCWVDSLLNDGREGKNDGKLSF